MTYNIGADLFGKTLFIILFIGAITSFAAPLDSLRTEQIDGKLFIIHQVDQGETLYAISRRYKVSVPDIVAHNPSAKLDLEIGILIQVPLPQSSKQIDKTGLTAHKVKSKETLFSLAKQYNATVTDIKSLNNLVNNELNIGQVLYIKPSPILLQDTAPNNTTNKVTHILQQGETLYSLSKKYEVRIDQLRNWNNLEENNLSIGQVMIVGETIAQEPAQVEIIPIKLDTIVIDSIKIAMVKPILTDTTQTSKQVVNVHGFEEIVESGIGEMIPGSTETRKYLGLHHTAKVGTIMKVRNEMNDKMVFVRIIGRIPNTGDNKKVLLKISKAAYDRLSIIDPRFRLEISYMP